MSRDPEQSQREIEASRAELASALDQLAERTSPKRLAGQAKESALVFFGTPPGMAVLGAVGLLVALRIARSVRNRRNS